MVLNVWWVKGEERREEERKRKRKEKKRKNIYHLVER